jgi:hypothetical protein
MALDALRVAVRVWTAGHESRYEITASIPISAELTDNAA